MSQNKVRAIRERAESAKESKRCHRASPLAEGDKCSRFDSQKPRGAYF